MKTHEKEIHVGDSSRTIAVEYEEFDSVSEALEHIGHEGLLLLLINSSRLTQRLNQARMEDRYGPDWREVIQQ